MVGFEIGNKETLPKIYVCHVCTLVFRDPVQIVCGHRYCQSCVNDKDKISVKCVQCEEVTLRSEIFSDLGIKNDMRLLNINCSSCEWMGLFMNYEIHLVNNHSNVLSGVNVNDIGPAASQTGQCNTSMDRLSIEESNCPQEILSLSQDCMVSYNGTLLLKIDNIQSDNKSVITSQPFYTSSNGYKICVRLYLNGTGPGESTHISIFFILMRGEYDALLKWPCDLQFISCLYDLQNKKDHIIKSFQSNTKPNHFQRSIQEMSTAIGFSKFIPRSKIQQDNNPYVCDDSIFIKIMVREDVIPLSILSNIISIDLALPMYMQEELIKKEIKKSQMPLKCSQ